MKRFRLVVSQRIWRTDYSVAFKLYNLSADQGFPKAHSNLGLMYRRGKVSLRITKLRPSGGLNNLHPGESEFCGEIGEPQNSLVTMAGSLLGNLLLPVEHRPWKI